MPQLENWFDWTGRKKRGLNETKNISLDENNNPLFKGQEPF